MTDLSTVPPPADRPTEPRARRAPAARGGGEPRFRLDAVWRGLTAFVRREGEARGKRIELVATGGEIEVAAPSAEALRTALSDLVRNAVDHGVETPAARLGAGKAALAVLRLSARRTGASVEVTLADDGRGIDPERMRAQCAADGRLTAADAEGLGARPVQGLAFDSGAAASRAAGPLERSRGAGLARVRAAVQAAGGGVALASAPGRGAAFTLTVPADGPYAGRDRTAA